MNFFQRLAENSAGLDISIRIKEKNGNLTVSVLPEAGNKARYNGKVLTGTPAELDAEFFDKVTPALQQAQGLIAQDIEAEAKKEKPTSTSKKQGKKADKKDKPKKEKQVQVKAEKPAMQEASIFDSPQEAGAGENNPDE